MILDLAFSAVDMATTAFQQRLEASTYMDSPAHELFDLMTNNMALGASLVAFMGAEMLGGLLNGMLDGLLAVVGGLENTGPISFPEPVLLDVAPPPAGFDMGMEMSL